MDNSRINIQLLPATLREIAEHHGLPAAIRLVENYGGTRVWVPEEIDRHHHLAKSLGWNAAVNFCQMYALEYLTIDKAERALRAIRDEDILRRLEMHETVASVARVYGLTERQIYNIKRGREAETQEKSQAELW